MIHNGSTNNDLGILYQPNTDSIASIEFRGNSINDSVISLNAHNIEFNSSSNQTINLNIVNSLSNYQCCNLLLVLYLP